MYSNDLSCNYENLLINRYKVSKFSSSTIAVLRLCVCGIKLRRIISKTEKSLYEKN